MGIEKLTITADTLDEAHEKLKLQMPEGHSVQSVDVISGKPEETEASGDNVATALAVARQRVPAQAFIIEEKVVEPPNNETFQIKTFNHKWGKSEADSETYHRFGSRFTIREIRLLQPGRRGILGIGKKPWEYEIEVSKPARVKIIFHSKAEIVASILTTEEYIEKLIEDLGNSKYKWHMYAEPDDSWGVEITDDGKVIREKAFQSLVSLGVIAIPRLCRALDDSRKPKIPINPYSVYPKSSAEFRRKGPDTEDGEEVGQTIAEILVQIGDCNLVTQQAETVQGVAKTRLLWVLGKLGGADASKQL